MKIKLNEIPEEGRSYIFNRQTAELNSVLQDILDNNDYAISLDIRPLNTKDFTILGSVTTQTREQCSRCAEDFNFSIEKKIHEILIPSQQEDRTGKYAKTSPNIINATDEEQQIGVTEYSKQQFDLGEFVHESIALEVPFNPHCHTCQKQGDEKAFIYDEKMGDETKPNPFEALKGLKLN